ncbi:HD domain-containing protein [Dehalococcoidia bacterium]|nr:HD domain-containing protein [Dehalococcoidia bacterium]
MRRISIEYAKPGMELGRPLFDKHGDMLLPACTVLEEKHLTFLKGKGVWEVLIEDPRVDDLTIKPLVKLDMQKEAVEAMRRLMNINKKGGVKKNLDSADMYGARLEVERLSYAIVQAILRSPLGEPDLSGCLLVEDFHYVQPVQSTILAILLAKEAGFDNTGLLAVGKAAMLQNIGYIWLPPRLWEKRSLSKEENQEFERHPVYGAELLRQYGRIPPEVTEAILQHHERWDGTGYPNGTRGWDISPFAQLIGIADTYYELVSARPGRKPYTPMDAFEYVMASGGELFDPELIGIFSRRVPIYPSGVMVKLNTGEIGIVVDANLGHVGRPVVRIVKDVKGNDMKPPLDMDLSKPEYQYKLITELLEI